MSSILYESQNSRANKNRSIVYRPIHLYRHRIPNPIMFVLILLLALTGSIEVDASQTDVSGINGEEIRSAYDEMNVKLVEEVPACDIQGTLDNVKAHLAEYSNTGISISISRLITGQSKLHQAYVLFGALSQLTDGHRCDANAINILRQNDLASGERAHSIPDKGECRKRVETVLLHYVNRSIRECPQKNADTMRQKLEHFDSDQFIQVDLLTKGVISNQVRILKNQISDRFTALVKLALKTEEIMRLALIHGFMFYSRLDSVIGRFAPEQKLYLRPINNEASGLAEVDKDKIKELFEEYAMKPCRNYVTILGPDVFEPEIYLSSFKHKPLKGDQEFYLNWIRYNTCKVYLDQETILLDAIIRSAS